MKRKFLITERKNFLTNSDFLKFEFLKSFYTYFENVKNLLNCKEYGDYFESTEITL